MNQADSFLHGANIEFIEALYDRWLADPGSVSDDWKKYFQDQHRSGQPIYSNAEGRPDFLRIVPPVNGRNGQAAAPLAPVVPISERSMGLQARADQTVYAFRLRGHLVAQLDPLGRPRAPLRNVADVALVSEDHFSAAELEELVNSHEVFPDQPRVKLKELLRRLRRTYCGHVGVEFMHILDSDRRRWLMYRMEHTENTTVPGPEEARHILTRLTYAESFERFLHTKYVGAKRFSVDGGESLIPMIDAMLERGGELGVREAVIGMAHRGRLNVLTNILGKSPDQIFSEFDGPTDPKAFLGRGDVKYHNGFSSDWTSRGGKAIHLTLAFNPSHLEVVYPVVEGRARAKQDRKGDAEGNGLLPLVIHGDAAFSGLGLVPETLNLSGLESYRTGGTVHIVINNQIGFTTEPEQGRTPRYATAAAQLLDVPVFHVNADDPEACVHVMRLATEFRQQFHADVVIDLICYRRYGHNEGDEPVFTQPKMYELIRTHDNVRDLYAKQLRELGTVPEQEGEQIRARVMQELQEAHVRAKAKSQLTEPSHNQGIWKAYRGGPDREVPEVETGLTRERAQKLLLALCQLPADFTPHPTIARLLGTRRQMVDGAAPVDWASAELLAYASLLTEGYHVRITGQDTERGTFSHRHAVIHDVKTGAEHPLLERLPERRGRCTVRNSPLSEAGCLGFEFGYSLDSPDALVAWEAQFGDFANNAQVVIDQFVAASEAKWRRLSGLTLLLPHGYEGAGPEHSSARLERFLQLCADDNLQVCYPTTAGQFFHLLRRQVLRPWRKPLVVMTPKGPLRRPEVAVPLEELTFGTFQRLLVDKPEIDPRKVTRLLLCSGKVYWDLAQGREAKKDPGIGILRVEQLYPLPEEAIAEQLKSMPKLKEVFWVQEEPRNNGAWGFVHERLAGMVSALPASPKLGYIGRIASASPATGFDATHKYEQQLIVEEATSRGKANGR